MLVFSHERYWGGILRTYKFKLFLGREVVVKDVHAPWHIKIRDAASLLREHQGGREVTPFAVFEKDSSQQ